MSQITNAVLQAAMEAVMQDDSEYVANLVLPTVDVAGQLASAQGEGNKYEFSYYLHGANNTRGPGERTGRRAELGEPSMVPTTLQDATGSAEEFAFRTALDLRKEGRMEAKGVRSWATEAAIPAVTMDLRIAQEKRVMVDTLQSSTEFTQSTTGAATNFWDNDANNPMDSIYEGLGNVQTNGGKRPNTLVFSQDHFLAFRENANIRRYVGDMSTVIPPAEAAKLIRDALMTVSPAFANEVDTDFAVFIAAATERTSNLGQTNAYDYIYDNAAWLGYVERREPSVFKASAAYQVAVEREQVNQIRDESRVALFVDAWHIMGEIVPRGLLGHRFVAMVENPVL